MSKRVLLTGVSSFTGAHIARALVDAGCTVFATLSASREKYSGLLADRLDYSGVSNFIENASFASEEFLKFLSKNEIDVFVNHGASIKGYRNADFDYMKSVQASTHNIAAVFEALKVSGCSRVVHTGSFFESEEGWALEEKENSQQFPAMSIYGVSKRLAWELLRFHSEKADIALSKVVIPNPIGVHENTDRLAPIFLKLWKAGKVPELRTPTHVRDNLPAEWLANTYKNEVLLAKDECGLRIRRPSGFVLSQQCFVEQLAEHARKKFGYECKVDIKPMPSSEQEFRSNSEPVAELGDPLKVTRFWDEWLGYLSSCD